MSIDIKKYRQEVSRPGKFEGEQPYAPYYYDAMGNGEVHYVGGDEDGEGATEYEVFQVDADESEAFDLPLHAYVVTWEDSQGFFYAKVFECSHDELVKRLEARH